MLRQMRVLLAVPLVLGAVSACASDPSAQHPASTGDCTLELTFRGQQYESIQVAMSRQQLTADEVNFPAAPQGRPIGSARQPTCGAADGVTEPVAVFSVPGVASAVALMNDGGNVALRHGADVPAPLRVGNR